MEDAAASGRRRVFAARSEKPRGDRAALAERCGRLDGRAYAAYRDLEGVWTLGEHLTLFVDRAAPDPFAPPTRMRLRLSGAAARIPAALLAGRIRRIALCDCLARRAAEAAGREARGGGSGHSGEIRVDAGSQEVLERTAIRLGPAPEGDGSGVAFVEGRVEVGLPAAGRRILGRSAASLLTGALPRVAAEGLTLPDPPPPEVEGFIRVVEEQETLRAALRERGLVAFVADGAVLPRLHGASRLPLDEDRAAPFASPPSLRVTLPLRAEGGETVSGMGIPEGVTLIAGGGYHGKSTLLQALAAAVFPHIPGDGRERCVTRADAVTVRAEEGRAVHSVDVSPFLRDLPGGRATESFSTEDASGSTSQAAAIVEALESGARLLLLDEDTSATNLLIRDARMQALVAGRAEPIVPFLDRARELFERHRVSTILVMGGSGDYFDAADTVIRMDSYRAADATAEARRIAAAFPTRRAPETDAAGFFGRERTPVAATFDASGRRGTPRIRAMGRSALLYGEREVPLFAVAQLFESSQTRAAGYAVSLLAARFAGRPVGEALDAVEALLDGKGLDVLTAGGRAGRHPGRFARPRRHEIAALLNRLRDGRFENRPVSGDASPSPPAGESGG